MVKRLADDESNCYHITHHKKPSTFCPKLYRTYEMGRDVIPNNLASLCMKEGLSRCGSPLPEFACCGAKEKLRCGQSHRQILQATDARN